MIPRHIPRPGRQLPAGTGLHRPVHSQLERVQPGQRPQLLNVIRLRSAPSHPGQHLRRHRPSRQYRSQDGRHCHQPRQPAPAAGYQRPDEKTQRRKGQHYRGRRYDDSSQRALPAPAGNRRSPATTPPPGICWRCCSLNHPKPTAIGNRPRCSGPRPAENEATSGRGVCYRRSACARARRVTALSDAQRDSGLRLRLR